MKLAFLFVLFIGVNGAPPSSGASSLVVSDETALTNIIETIEAVGKLMRRTEEKFLFNIVSKAADENCMLNKYKTKNLTSHIPTGELVKTGMNQSTEVMFFNIGLICSTKTDSVLKTIFDVAMSLHSLLKSVIEDSKYHEYVHILHCANNHAVETNILNTSIYNFDHNVKENFEEFCDDFVEEKNLLVSRLRSEIRSESKRPCSMKVVADIEKIVIKTVLLIQIEMTDDQRNQERMSFMKTARKILENALSCTTQKPRS